jgi:aldehyde dehydrogenase (NAD+)
MQNSQQIINVIDNQQLYFNSLVTRPYEFRMNALTKLKQAIVNYEKRLSAALFKDLGKSEYEAYATEIGFVLHDLSITLKSLKKWMQPKKVATPFYCQPASSKIESVPLGVNLIISPFNYPVGLTFSPLIAAIAAGNTAVVKVSELTPNVSQVIESLIYETFSPEMVAFISGGVEQTTELLKQQFSHIFFTGSPRVGKIVMQAAAKFLTPVTLELGGKSPCIVDSDANIDIAVKRIVYGKFLNAGQTCIAPDYVLLHEGIYEQFLEKLKKRIVDLYGENPVMSPDFGRIINADHFQRIINLIDKDRILVGGLSDPKDNYIAPTVIKDVKLSDKIMKEEIFGPVLAVMKYSNIDEVYKTISALPQHPLACYIFSENRLIQNELVEKIQSGGVCINHCLQHIVNPNLPFGGIGQSGIGSYHGYSGFELFSHKKSVLKAATWFDMRLLYPPYAGKLRYLRKIWK